MKIMETEITYKCGHTNTRKYAKGATASEVKREKHWAENLPCWKCLERLASNAEGIAGTAG